MDAKFYIMSKQVLLILLDSSGMGLKVMDSSVNPLGAISNRIQ